MKNGKFLILSVLILTLFSACQKKEEAIQNAQKQENSVKYSKIEEVDFKNFSFFYGENDSKKVTLTNGAKTFGGVDDIAFDFDKVLYADLTKDKEDEAIVNLRHGNGAIATNLVSVYTLQNNQPKKIWSFYVGSESNGRLKDVYLIENDLVVELFGKNELDTVKNEFGFAKDFSPAEAFCCPKNFTQFVLQWNGEKFIPKEKPQVFDYKAQN
ncbi:MAG TPA: hypothetical protein PKY59_01835 [Pyrinomonadaceae bacterium]|nr:hypothetical protein [Pyrinomonadaceae bacterium]